MTDSLVICGVSGNDLAAFALRIVRSAANGGKITAAQLAAVEEAFRS